MNDKTISVSNVAWAILVVFILVTAVFFFYLGLSAEGLAVVALAIANIAFRQANNVERRVRICLKNNDELIQILEKTQQGEELRGISKSEQSESGDPDERS